MEYLLLFAAILILIFALSKFILFRLNLSLKNSAAKKTASKKILANCPLCGSHLFQGQNIISKVYRPMNVPDQRCTVSGCPHCFPVCEAGVRRVCPVCKKNVAAQGYLVSRLFNKASGKKHVMILGCNSCLKNEAK